MSRVGKTLAALILCVGLPVSFGCGSDSQPPTAPVDKTGALVPDFQLVDVNATSPTYNHAVSPRDHLERISAWYFGAAT